MTPIDMPRALVNVYLSMCVPSASEPKSDFAIDGCCCAEAVLMGSTVTANAAASTAPRRSAAPWTAELDDMSVLLCSGPCWIRVRRSDERELDAGHLAERPPGVCVP